MMYDAVQFLIPLLLIFYIFKSVKFSTGQNSLKLYKRSDMEPQIAPKVSNLKQGASFVPHFTDLSNSASFRGSSV